MYLWRRIILGAVTLGPSTLLCPASCLRHEEVYPGDTQLTQVLPTYMLGPAAVVAAPACYFCSHSRSFAPQFLDHSWHVVSRASLATFIGLAGLPTAKILQCCNTCEAVSSSSPHGHMLLSCLRTYIGILQKSHFHSALETTKRTVFYGWDELIGPSTFVTCIPVLLPSFHCLHSKVFHHFFLVGPVLLLQQRFYQLRVDLSAFFTKVPSSPSKCKVRCFYRLDYTPIVNSWFEGTILFRRKVASSTGQPSGPNFWIIKFSIINSAKLHPH